MQGFDPTIPAYHGGLLSAPLRQNFQALYTNNKGPAVPTNLLDGQWWIDSADLANQCLKLYRSATADWLTLIDKTNTIGLLKIPVNNFTFTQAVPSATWTITHGLGKYPSVVVVNASRVEIPHLTLTYTDTDNIVITFSAVQSGYAYLT